MNAIPARGEPSREKLMELRALVDGAQQGDKTALLALRTALTNQDLADIGGDLARLNRDALIAMLAGENLLVQESTRSKVDLLRAELTGPNATPLERLLVERIVSCWLHLHYIEWCAQKEGRTIPLATYYQRSLSFSQKRYVDAIKALAVVRRLALPALQVNIAKDQVNVANVACSQ